MAVTLQNIADTAKVAVSTVSRVLNNRNDPHISEKTANRIIQAARELGYQPNLAARALVTGQTNTIALWTSEVYPSLYSYTIHSLRHILKLSKYELQIVEMEKHYDSDGILPSISFWQPDGLLVFEVPWYVEEYINAGGNIPKPLVSMGVNIMQNGDYVGIDIYSGVVEAMEHLYNSGRRRIAFLMASDEIIAEDQRYLAYKHVMEKAGLETECITFPKESSIDQRRAARKGIAQYVKQHGCPDAIFCYNDETAVGGYRGLRDIGVRIFDDVALVGCDGIEDTEYMDTPISTIVQPLSEMCDIGWDFLKHRIDDPSMPQQKAMLKAEFVIRESC